MRKSIFTSLVILSISAFLAPSCKKDEPGNPGGEIHEGSLVSILASSTEVAGSDSIRFTITRKADTETPFVITATDNGEESTSLYLVDGTETSGVKHTYFSGEEIAWLADGTAAVVWQPESMESHKIVLTFTCGKAKETYSFDVSAQPLFHIEGLPKEGICIAGQSITIKPVFEPAWYKPDLLLLESSDNSVMTLTKAADSYILKGVQSGEANIKAMAADFEWSVPMEIWTAVKATAYINSSGCLAVSLNGVATCEYEITANILATSTCTYTDDDAISYIQDGRHITKIRTRSYNVSKILDMNTSGSTNIDILTSLDKLLEGYEIWAEAQNFADDIADVRFEYGKAYYTPESLSIELEISTDAPRTVLTWNKDFSAIPTKWSKVMKDDE